MFVIYNIIDKCKTVLGYILLVQTKQWIKIEQLIMNLTSNNLITIAEKRKEINNCTNSAILAFEQQV